MSEPLRSEAEVFGTALRLPAGQRAAYLSVACAGDESLRQRVEELLAVHEDAGAFLSGPAQGAPGLTPAALLGVHRENPVSSAPAEKVGDRIGRYKLLQPIGEGGCGVVYLAEQEEPVRRQVALKVIKLGMDTKSVIARFEAERQAMAMMDHPNIAKVFDAGATDTGRPYFVMELVPGLKITDYCDQSGLSTAARLDLFVHVCRALQHAHQKGIIHRDIKPSNILVTVHDGVAVPKVIDFGIAKATQGKLTDQTLFTSFQQFLGTPAYMSPEQAALTSLDIDTRSDIYSLGVLLYELLTGKTPFDTRELLAAGLDAMRRTILECEPARPSTRLSTMVGADLAAVAKHRQTDPPKLIHTVRGDLDWIVLKALEKDRTRRYETANDLARDVQQFLRHEPVSAAAPGTGYRFRKFVRRHRTGALVAGSLALVLLLGIAGTTWGLLRALRQQHEAERQGRIAGQIRDFLTGMFTSIDPAVAKRREITVRETLDEAGRNIETAFTNEPLTELPIRQTLSGVYRKLGRGDLALRHSEAALRLSIKAHGNRDHPDVAASLNLVALDLQGQGRVTNALPMFEAALAMRQRLDGRDSAPLAESRNNLAYCLEDLGRHAEALTNYEAALAMYQRIHPGDDVDVARELSNLGGCLEGLGRAAEALPKHEASLAMKQRIYRGDHPEVAAALNNAGHCLVLLGRANEGLPKLTTALAMKQRIYRGDHPDLAISLAAVASCFRDLGRSAEALTNYEAATAMFQRIFPGDHPDVARTGLGVALSLQDLGRPAEALPIFETGLAMRRRIYPGDHPEVAESLSALGLCLMALSRSPEAMPDFKEALAIRQHLYPGDHPDVAIGLNNVAYCLYDLGRAGEALPSYEAALAMYQRIYPGDHPDVARALNNVASCLRTVGRPMDALPRFEAALAMRQRIYPGDHPVVAQNLGAIAFCLNALGRPADALPKQEATLAMFQRIHPGDHPDVARALNNLGLYLNALGRSGGALTNFEAALAMRRRLYPGDHTDVAISLDNLALGLRQSGRPAEALPQGREALAMCRRLIEAQPGNNAFKLALAKTRQLLGDLAADTEDSRGASNEYRDGLETVGIILASDPANADAARLRLGFRVRLGLEAVEVVVLETGPGSPAWESGLLKNDVLERYAGHPITSVEHLTNLAASNQADPVELKIRRDGKPLMLAVRPGSLGVAAEDRPIPGGGRP